MRIEFEVPGEPKAKARPRMTKHGFAYTPETTVNYENWVKECYYITNQSKTLSGAIRCEIQAHFQMPKSASKKKTAEMIAGEIRPQKKPDLDNICKAILDSLNGIAYKDDSQVVELIMSKHYAERPRVEIVLEAIS